MMAQKSNRDIVLDLGNSTVSSAIFEDGNIIETWKIPSQDLLSSHEFKRAIVDSLPFERDELNISSVYVSSVVHNKTENLIKALVSIFGDCVKKASIDVRNTLIDRTTISNELGVDIYANLVEARVKKPGDDVIVVDFGTALTVSLIDSNGHVKGVAIAPGIKSSLRGLLSVAPALSSYADNLNIPLSSLGEDTETAINAGMFYGARGMVRELVHQMERENGKKCYHIATGGHSRMFAPFVDIFDEIDVNHTIKGIYNIFNF